MSWCSNWNKHRCVCGCVTECVTAGKRGAGRGGKGLEAGGVYVCVSLRTRTNSRRIWGPDGPGKSQPLLERWLDMGVD